MSRKPWFWIVLLVASLACAVAMLRHRDALLPLLEVDVSMTRDDALAKAASIAESLRLSPAKLTRSAAAFQGDSRAQLFIEQEGGGRPALAPFLREGEHVLYVWRTRLFEPGVTHEVSVYFTPAGRPYGFRARVPEAEAGAVLEADAARAIALERATTDWKVDFAQYKPVSTSTAKRTGGRMDHEFRYERVDTPIGEGKLLLTLVVSGDKLTALARGFQVPEAFERRYQERRSANSTISAAANIVVTLAYMLGGCLLGSIWLLRRGAWTWRPAAWLALGIALLVGFSVLDSIPSSWLGYNTATSSEAHYAKAIGAAVAAAVMWWAVLLATFTAGEGLGRLAFPSHPYLWGAWAPRTGATGAIVGRTLGGYAWVGFELAFVAVFYFVAQRYFGWWSPGSLMIDPNILSHAQPWIDPVANALRAGVWEEFLFRAVPLAGAALLGRHFGRGKLFIGVGLVLQAVVFGCAHATYPQEPSWARPVELFLPSIVWGLVYLRYGILPGILMHFIFDLVLMSTPLWATSAPGIGFDRAMVVLCALVPLIVVAVRVARARGLAPLAAIDINAHVTRLAPAWHAVATVPRREATAAATPRWAVALLMVLGLAGAAGWIDRITTPYDAPGLSITREQALRIAEDAVVAEGAKLGPDWRRLSKVEGPRDQEPHAFVWQKGGEAMYRALLGNHLAPPLWAVRFARFEGEVDVADRAESWFVFVAGDGTVRAIHHRLPEARAGARLTEEAARNKAHEAVGRWLGVDPSALRFVSGRASNKPGRLDWEFIYADPSRPVPPGGEAYVQVDIAGDQVVARGRYVFVPEDWTRERKAKRDSGAIVTGIAGLALLVALSTILVLVIRRFARREFSKRGAIVGAVVGFGFILAQRALGLEATMTEAFDTAQPITQQYVREGMVALAFAATVALLMAVMVGVAVRIASHAARSGAAAWRDAAALVFLAMGGPTLARWIWPVPREPRLPPVRDAESFAPVVASLLDSVDFMMFCAIAVAALGVLDARRGWRSALVAALFVCVGVIAGSRSPEWSVLTLAGGVVAGLAAWWIFRRYVLGRIEIVAPLIACGSVLAAIGTIARPTYAQAVPAAIVGMLSVAAGYLAWQWLVHKEK
ncbi:hypothetical protein DSM104443_03374 [Usitatibacter rugosus]|uniref:CPBP family intramembrane metalloprotease n=1 Tax=Usitatibacter rugosus TaxID=2732067 RepID=A0A6M4GYF7_9PROT|nr:CPBP family intramembrane glutamic endopeptidase [Usitatibacter rugosus]QJR12289.1 hypothetical protein DSM104443_03374 [Usitatibacter rugosus]